MKSIQLIAGAAVPAVAALLLISSGSADVKTKAAPKAKVAAKSPKVMGHLMLLDRKITLKSGGLYTIKSRDGKVIAEDLTLQQLKAVDPVLQERLERTISGKAAPGTRWAGL